MAKVAKLLMIDNDGRYLMLYRSDHPTFGADPDLPGGTLEDGETLLETVLREVQEEIGVKIDPNSVESIYSGTEYSAHRTHYELFSTHIHVLPQIVLSWEHSRYTWLNKQEFIAIARSANDTYMHMVADTIERKK